MIEDLTLFTVCYLAELQGQERLGKQASKWASIAIISCNDLDDTGLIIYHTGNNCNVNHVPCITSIELPESVSCISGLDSNEEQDVGHEFKQPVVCQPASWQCNEYLGDEDARAHTHTVSDAVWQWLGSVILIIMQSDNAGSKISHRRGRCFIFLQR